MNKLMEAKHKERRAAWDKSFVEIFFAYSYVYANRCRMRLSKKIIFCADIMLFHGHKQPLSGTSKSNKTTACNNLSCRAYLVANPSVKIFISINTRWSKISRIISHVALLSFFVLIHSFVQTFSTHPLLHSFVCLPNFENV